MLQLRKHAATSLLTIALLAATMAFGAASAVAQQGGESDSGTFVIMADRNKIATEKFKIARSDEGIEATAQIEVETPGSPKISETATLKVGKNGMPVSYVRQQTSPKKGTLTVEFGTPESKVTSVTSEGTDDRLFFLPATRLAVLDTNLFHQYGVLLRLYDAAQGGAQVFNVFVPQEATPGTLTLELLGAEKQTVGKVQRDLSHYKVTTDEVTLDLWATPKGEIQRIAIDQAKIEVVRQ